MNLIPLQLLETSGIGDAFIRRFADFVVSNGEDAGEQVIHSVRELSSTFSIKTDVAEVIVRSQERSESLLQKLEKNKIKWVWLADSDYPNHLRTVLGKAAPPILFYRGNLKLCVKPSVGFCGSRAASEYGISITQACCEQLVARDAVIVSGYANGVDVTAHKTALQNNGSTTFILAEGLLHFREKREFQGLLYPDKYLILSQFPPNAEWSGRNAMCRNSTIIGLSNAMVLIESGLHGGTFAAGEECLRRKHPFFVVDFAMQNSSNIANSDFIRRGGIPIRSRHGLPNLDILVSMLTGISLQHGNR